MLQKDNEYRVLKIFFDDPVPGGMGFQLRELSRKTAIAPPSVKKYLARLEKERLITKASHRIQGYPLYYANRDGEEFRFLKKLDNLMMISECGLLEYISEVCMPDAIVLFGSASKGEDLKGSDIDIFILSGEEKLNLSRFEKKLNRSINLLFSKDFKKLSKELRNNILNGIILKGYLKVF
jgi:predicted nucleotidyltransferase